MDVNTKITIPLEQYEDLIIAQMKLEQLINAREKYHIVFANGDTRVFDAIVSGGC